MPYACKQNSRDFFQRLLGMSSKFLPNAFMSQTLQSFWVISTLLFCSLCLMFSFFAGGLPPQKGVCILDIFCRATHFNSKWRVKYLVLFVLGAASLRRSRCKQNSRIFFSAPSGSFLPKFLQKAFMSRTLHFCW